MHIAPCIVDHCPEAPTLIKKIAAKAGCEVIEGAAPLRAGKHLRLNWAAIRRKTKTGWVSQLTMQAV